VRYRHADLTQTLEQLPLPVFMVDATRTITFLNAAARSLIGEDGVGKHFTTYVAPESQRVARDDVARTFLGKEAGSEHESVIVGPGGRRVVVEMSTAPLEDAGEVVGVFGVAVPRGELPAAAAPTLTPRQAEVLRQLAAGASTEQMEASLGVSRDTVRNHIRDVLKRLGVHSRLEAVLVARERGLV
jgi:PAS domain S-box-containing protein